MKLSKVKVGMRVKWWDHLNNIFQYGNVTGVSARDFLTVDCCSGSVHLHVSVFAPVNPRRVAREFWVTAYDDGVRGYTHASKEEAEKEALPGGHEIIRVREVLEKRQ